MGPDIAGRVLEIVTKKKFDLLAQQKLLRPLGMRQTTFSTIDASAVSPSEGARGTAADYIRFLRMLLNGGMHNGQRILSESSVGVLRTVLTTLDNRKYSPEGVSGWEFALGAWAPGAAGAKEATVLTCPSFGGTTPQVDFCRGYAFMYLQKELTDEQKQPVAQQIKNVLDSLFRQQCR
jgi:CubicO group peptidase (beta-lactamase class C family)